ncbi:MAG: hypothetical protein ACOYI8_04470 [Christensenellales bacterium]|jgi:putative aldouronate transport system permease protein
MGNTVKPSLHNLIFGFPMPILFALLLNEVRSARWSKFLRTASYLPYFVSIVVVSSTETNGFVNNIPVMPGGNRVAQRTGTLFPSHAPS